MTKLLLNQNLIKSLINSDFLLIEKKKNRKNIKYNSSNIFSIDKKTIFCLEPLEVSMLLKQMIRYFYFISKMKHLKKELHLFFNEDDTTLSSLAKGFFKNEYLNTLTSFIINSNKSDLKVKNFNKQSVGFIFDTELSADKNFFKKQFNKNILLFFELNPSYKIELNSYKIQTTFIDYKRALFFFSLLRQVLQIIHNKK